jgi:hypothetical protein
MEKHEYLALKYEIEQMRQRDTIQGYVITELTDANWEANGLMSIWRRPKAFAEELGKLQQDDLVIASFAVHNFTSGSPVAVPLTISHYSTVSLDGATIQWQTSDGQSGVMPVSTSPPPGGVAPQGTLEFKAAPVTAPAAAFLRLQLVDSAGAIVAQNRYRFALYPQNPLVPAVTVTIHDPLNQLQNLRAVLRPTALSSVTTAQSGSLRRSTRPPAQNSTRAAVSCCWREAGMPSPGIID